MTSPALEYSVDRGIGRLTFVRPDQLNSLDDQALDELTNALADAGKDASLKALCLTGTGRAFSVGLDLGLLQRAFFDLPYWEGVLYKLNEIYLAMEALPCPVIASVNGLARAGGYEFTLAADLVLIADEAKIGDVHAPFGVPPGGGASFRLARRVGEMRAKELIFTGRWLDGPEAAAYGLALRSVPLARLQEETDALLDTFRPMSRTCLGVAKDMVHANRFLAGRPAVDSELGRFMQWAHTDPQAAEGMQAFMDKRTPSWDPVPA
ncbi:MAG TPA: enoyl-CoA hydratase/isomerase family protein [Mycobacteriales bacterium]|jgi:enoyl-CoA hydratase/carnithine racemase|nr:enoyl-CoA hydratase/isomerase family protein [Mycobacteriales bacterium]